MIYITEKGTKIPYEEPIFVHRTLSFKLNSPSKYDPNKMIDAVSREGKGYVSEIRFRDKFKHPNGELAHSYDVVFRIPYHEVIDSRIMVNKLMVKIEVALENEANINFGGFGRHRREWMDEEFLKG